MSFVAREVRNELRPMLSLALPVVLGELGWMAMGIVDTMMVGRLSAEAIGAVSIGRALFIFVGVLGIGLLLGLDPLISRAHGAGRTDECHEWLIQGTFLGAGLAVPMTAALLALVPTLALWVSDEGVREPAAGYLGAVAWSLLPLLVYFSFRRYLQAINLVRPVMLVLLSANLVNAAANWLLIFGKLGFPALGATGAGWATVIASSYLVLGLGATILIHDREQPDRLRDHRWWPEPARLRELLRLGFPAAIQLGLELGVFTLATAFAARLDPVSLAAHQIALVAASTTYMVPLGVSSSGAVRVGQALGRSDPVGASRAGWTALLLGGGFMLIAAAAFLTLPRPLLRAFTPEADVIAAGVALLAVAAFFQLFDGLQVVATGALRGAGDTRTPMLWSLIGHWLVGLPVGYVFCFRLGFGVVGLWVGLSAGLILIGAALLRVWWRRAHQLVRAGAVHAPR